MCAERFAQRADLYLEVLFRHHNARPHAVEELFFCNQQAVGLQQDQKEIVPSPTGTPSASICRRRNSTRKLPNSRAASAVAEFDQFASCCGG